VSGRHSFLWVLAVVGLAGCGLVPPAPSAGGGSFTASGALASAATPKQTPPAVNVRGFSEFEQAALRVRNIGCGSLSIGSGFAISDHAFITNRHVIGGANLLQVQTFDGHDVQVTTAGAAIVADLAIVRTVEALPAKVPLAQTNPLPGTTVTVVGYPLGGPLTTSHGHVLRYAADLLHSSVLPMMVNDAHIEHGSSGSPVLDAAGQLVGVAYAGTEGGPYYAVPIEVLNTLLAEQRGFDQSPSCDGFVTSSPGSTGSSANTSTTPCSATVSVGPETSCSFGLNVEAAWHQAGGGNVDIEVYSSVTKQNYSMTCEAGAPSVCRGGNNAVVYIRP
jgi:S1-C subfamily serine protease